MPSSNADFLRAPREQRNYTPLSPVINSNAINTKLDAILSKLDRVGPLEKVVMLAKEYQALVQDQYEFKTRKAERDILTKLFEALEQV